MSDNTLLFADIGNSSIKIYREDGSLQVFSYNNSYNNAKELSDFIAADKPEYVLVSSVSETGLKILKKALKNIKILVLDYKSDFSFKIDIENPETVGIDRLLNIESALYEGISPNFIVIDAGSGITIDVVCKEEGSAVFKGGLIIPGEYLQYKSLINNTDIKNIEKQIIHNGIIGKNTKHAITSGIRNCLLYGIKGIILRLALEYNIDKVVVSGRGSSNLKENKDFIENMEKLDIVFKEKLIYSGFISMAKKLKIL